LPVLYAIANKRREVEMISLEVFPGSIGVVSQALDKFGEARVSVGAWDEPVRINDLTAEEAAFAQKYFEDIGFRVVEK
jgi:hypothetical protein